MNLWCIIKTIRVLRLVPKQLSLNGIYRVECLQQSNRYLLISNWFVLMNSYLACVFQMTTKKTYMISRFTIKYPLFLMLFILTIGNPQLISWSWFMKLWPNNMTLERIQMEKKSRFTQTISNHYVYLKSNIVSKLQKKTSTDLCRWNDTLLMNMTPNFVCIFVTYFAQ